MNFNVLKTKALSKNQMRAIKGGSGTCGYKSPTGTVKCGVSKAQAMHMATEEVKVFLSSKLFHLSCIPIISFFYCKPNL